MGVQLYRNDDSVMITSPYWKVVHDLEQGGCISSVVITHASGKNLLKSPVSAAVNKRFFECKEKNPKLDVKEKKKSITLTFSGVMKSNEDIISPLCYEHSYTYTLYSIQNDLKIIPGKNFKVRVLTACEIELDKSLNEYSWGSTDFNKLTPRSLKILGPHYDDYWGNFNNAERTVIEESKRPWQVSVFARGKEGLSWSGDSKQYQWDSPVSGMETGNFKPILL